MSLKKYLLICYGLTLTALLMVYGLWWLNNPRFPLGIFIVFASVQALLCVFVFNWALGVMVPEERRTSFWSYRASNGCLALLLAGVLAVALASVFTVL